MNRRLALAAMTFAVGVLGASSALGQDSGWQVRITPYFWATGVSGDVTAPYPLAGREVEADFGDVLDHLNAAFLGTADVRYGRFGVVGDFVYLSVGGGETRNPTNIPTIGTKVELDATTATLAGYYRVYDSERGSVDLLGGLRYNEFKTKLDATVGGPGIGRKVTKEWTDPVIGVRGSMRTGARGSVTGYGDYGGFGVNDSTVWQVVGTYNYQWTESLGGVVGLRYWSLNLDKPVLTYDLDIFGPLIGVSFTF
ncbi:MAG: hypothetical protein ACREE0_02045 [Phenylobacterium sp.]